MKAHQRVLTWPSPWRQIALVVILLLTCLDWAGMFLVRLWSSSTPPFRLAALILAVIVGAMLAGCAQLSAARPTFELREKPSHTCTGLRDCFGQVWIGFRVPINL